MFEMKASSVIAELVRILVPRHEMEYTKEGFIQKPGLYIELDCRITDFGFSKKDGNKRERKEKTESTVVHFIFCGNVNTFAWHQTKGVRETPKAEDFINVSNHDSCWRTDGVESYLSKIYFDFCKKVNSELAPKELVQWTTFWQTPKPVTVEFGINPDEASGRGRFKLVKIPEIRTIAGLTQK